jgi:hypothetical protein
MVKSYPGGYRRGEQKSIRTGISRIIHIAAKKEPQRLADFIHALRI